MKKMNIWINMNITFVLTIKTIFTATCFSNLAVMGSLDVRLSVRNVGEH